MTYTIIIPRHIQDYLAFRDELLIHAASYEKLSKLMASQSTAPVNMDDWQRVENLWDTLEKQVRYLPRPKPLHRRK